MTTGTMSKIIIPGVPVEPEPPVLLSELWAAEMARMIQQDLKLRELDKLHALRATMPRKDDADPV